MSFVNLCTPRPANSPSATAEADLDTTLYGPSPYDINFAFPLLPPSLEGTHVRLTPFIPRVHGKTYWAAIEPVSGELFRYFGVAFLTMADNLAYLEKFYRENPEFILFAIIDKTRSAGRPSGDIVDDATSSDSAGSLAGVIGLLRASPDQLKAEIGYAIVFPAFQRTHVATHAVGLLLRYCLDLPSATPPGLGLRRVQWSSHSENIASIRVAEKMGFKREGLIRWMWAVNGEGQRSREGDPKEDKRGCHTVILAMCWDDWEEGGRDHVHARLGT